MSQQLDVLATYGYDKRTNHREFRLPEFNGLISAIESFMESYLKA